MALNDIEQIKTLLSEKKHILIACRAGGDGDTIGSALALSLWLQKQGKMVDIVSSEFALPSSYKFLNSSEHIKAALPPLQKFVLTVDVRDVGMEALTYDIQEEKLRIFITPKHGVISRDRVRTAQSDFLYDLIICLDTPDLASLGALYENNTELFFNIPLLTIDHHPEHERFGQINFLEITSTTTAEVVYKLMHILGSEYIDTDIATALLTGVIAKTRSFKNEATRPRLLTLASTLIDLGANRDAIVTQLFRTRTVATLKVWGQTLNHLQQDKSLGLVWSTLTREDFARSGAAEADLTDVIDELISNAREAKIVLLFHEHADNSHAIHVIAKAGADLDLKNVLAPYHPHGEKQLVSFTVQGKNLSDVEQEVIEHIKTPKHLNT